MNPRPVQKYLGIKKRRDSRFMAAMLSVAFCWGLALVPAGHSLAQVGELPAQTKARQAREREQQAQQARQEEQARRERAEAENRKLREELEALRRQKPPAVVAPQAAAPAKPVVRDAYPRVVGLAEADLKQLQTEAATRRGVEVGFRDALKGGGSGPVMVVVPPGRFDMGSTDGDEDEEPMRVNVRVEAFAMGRTEVTVGEYLACVAAGGCAQPEWRDPGSKYHYQTGSEGHYRQLGEALTNEGHPIVGVSWNDAKRYVAWLSAQTNKDYRLASEAEWEYAARAGSAGKWSHGDDETRLADHAWYGGNSGGKTHSVAGKLPNGWGLHDMAGNAWEWTEDSWHQNYNGAPQDGAVWKAGADGTRRVLRGGSWFVNPRVLRAADRDWDSPGGRGGTVGFRIARTLFTL
jgi:formylglycine-generating enzyme required for sulfatase activity